jgi:hypothetical protein
MMGFLKNYLRAELHFGNGDGSFGTDLYTSLTAETLISLNRVSLAVYHLENLSRTCCYTFLIATTLIFVYNYFKHYTPP